MTDQTACAACGEPVSYTDDGGCVGTDPAYHFKAECLLEAARRERAEAESLLTAFRVKEAENERLREALRALPDRLLHDSVCFDSMCGAGCHTVFCNSVHRWQEEHLEAALGSAGAFDEEGRSE